VRFVDAPKSTAHTWGLWMLGGGTVTTALAISFAAKATYRIFLDDILFCNGATDDCSARFRRDRESWAIAASIVGAAGVTMLALGTTLILWSPKKSAVWLAPNATGASLGGSF